MTCFTTVNDSVMAVRQIKYKSLWTTLKRVSFYKSSVSCKEIKSHIENTEKNRLNDAAYLIAELASTFERRTVPGGLKHCG